MRTIRLKIIIIVVLFVSTLFVYGQTARSGFVYYDDDEYVAENARVQGGLTAENMRWAFTAAYAGTWQPLVWISYMAEAECFGMAPAAFHITNAAIHFFNSILVFVVFAGMTGMLRRSAVVALLFAVHPLHVESVAWIAGRKDVLCAFFGLAATGAYAWYAARPGTGRYIAVMVCFALGLMAKPMILTLPFVFLLLDFWPLGRMRARGACAGGKLPVRVLFFSDNKKVLLDKIPLLVLVVISAVITYQVQQKAGAVASADIFPLPARIGNALTAYTAYLRKTLWPFDLAVFYPHPGMPPVWQWAGAVSLLTAITGIVFYFRRSAPWAAIGWFWFTGTLVPVIGIVQIGSHAMADRFAYIPNIGLYLIIAWSVPALVTGRLGQRAAGAGAAIFIILMAVLAARQASCWRDAEALFRRTLAVTGDNVVAYHQLGKTLAKKGEYTEARRHLESALRLYPNFAEAHNNLGNVLAAHGDLKRAETHYKRAIAIDPEDAEAYNNLGVAFFRQHRLDAALAQFQTAMQLDPGIADYRTNYTAATARKAELAKNIKAQIERVAGDPDNGLLRLQLAGLYRKAGRFAQAAAECESVLAQDPENVPAWMRLADSYRDMNAYEKAIAALKKAVRIDPGQTAVYPELARMYILNGNFAAARDWLKKAKARGFNRWSGIASDPDFSTILDRKWFRELRAAAKK